MSLRPLSAVLVLSILTAAGPAAAGEKIWSYDSADETTRGYVDSGLTFVFDKSLFSFRVKEVRATQAHAVAEVTPVSERELGGDLNRLLPAGAYERELYAVSGAGEGPAMVRALCPGSSRGWLVIGPLRARKDVRVHALGDDPATGAPRYCATLSLRYRGAWELPLGVRAAPPAQNQGAAPF